MKSKENMVLKDVIYGSHHLSQTENVARTHTTQYQCIVKTVQTLVFFVVYCSLFLNLFHFSFNEFVAMGCQEPSFKNNSRKLVSNLNIELQWI